MGADRPGFGGRLQRADLVHRQLVALPDELFERVVALADGPLLHLGLAEVGGVGIGRVLDLEVHLVVVRAGAVNFGGDLDQVARIGGDEFVILVTGQVPNTRLANMSSRILGRLKDPIMFEGNPCKISTSIGISSVKNGEETTSDLIMQQADRALYVSKENGRSQYSFFADCADESGSP